MEPSNERKTSYFAIRTKMRPIGISEYSFGSSSQINADDRLVLNLIGIVFTQDDGQLSLTQNMMQHQGIGRSRLLPAVLRGCPDVNLQPISHIGAQPDWTFSSLWS